MHSSFKVYLLTGTFWKGNGQLCQYNLAKFLFSIFLMLNFFHYKKPYTRVLGRVAASVARPSSDSHLCHYVRKIHRNSNEESHI